MLKKIISPIIIASALAIFANPKVAQALELNLSVDYSNFSSQQNIPVIWNAINLGSSTISNYDIKKYLEIVHLTDNMLVQLFKEAKENYDEYELLKDKWLKSHFNEGLKQLAYIQMVQKYATRSSDKSKWKAFKTTEKAYDTQVQAIEDMSLKKLLSEGKGIAYARKAFGEELIKAGYPHKNSDDGQIIYKQWYERQKNKIKENFRIKELQKFEYFTALGYSKELYVRPIEIFDFAKEISATIKKKIQNKRIEQAQVAKLLLKNPKVKVMLKKIDFYGPATTQLSVLKEQAPEVYGDFIKKLDTKVISFISNDFTKKIKHYETIAAKMANKYKSSIKLEELSEDMKKEFLNSNDYSRLMMSKIYELASVGLKGKIYIQDNKKRKLYDIIISQYLKALAKNAKQFLNDKKSMLNAQSPGVRLGDNFFAVINKDYRDNNMSGLDTEKVNKSVYLDQVRKLANWVLKFQLKKAALNTMPKAVVNLYDVNNLDGQKRIEQFLKNKQFKDKIESFKKNKLRNYWNGILTLTPNGRDYYTNIHAVNYVLGIKEERNDQSFDFLGQH